MKCYSCKKPGRQARRGAYQMDFGLDEKVVVHDVELSYCPACGDEAVGIDNVEGLMDAVTRIVATKQGRLTPKEIAYLRKHLDVSQAVLAKHLGVDPATVSRWESSMTSQAMGVSAERLLRLMVIHKLEHGDVPPTDHMGGDDNNTPKKKIELTERDGKWAA